jgi:hypothetical protein
VIFETAVNKDWQEYAEEVVMGPHNDVGIDDSERG